MTQSVAEQFLEAQAKYNRALENIKLEVIQTQQLLGSSLETLVLNLQERSRNLPDSNPFNYFLKQARKIQTFVTAIEEILTDFPNCSVSENMKDAQQFIIDYMILYYEYNQDDNFQDKFQDNKKSDDFQFLIAKPWQLFMKFELFYQEVLKVMKDYHEKVLELVIIDPSIYSEEDLIGKKISQETSLKINAKIALYQGELVKISHRLALANREKLAIKACIEDINKNFGEFTPQISMLIGAIKGGKAKDQLIIAVDELFDTNSDVNDKYIKNVKRLYEYINEHINKDINPENLAKFIVMIKLLDNTCLKGKAKKLKKIGDLEIERLDEIHRKLIDKIDSYINHICKPVLDLMEDFSKKMAGLDSENLATKGFDDETCRIFFTSISQLMVFLEAIDAASSDNIKHFLQKSQHIRDRLVSFLRGGTVQTQIVNSVVDLVLNQERDYKTDIKKVIKGSSNTTTETLQEELYAEKDSRLKVALTHKFEEDAANIVAMIVMARMLDRHDKKNKDILTTLARHTIGGSEDDNIRQILLKIEIYFKELGEEKPSNEADQIMTIFNHINAIDKIADCAERIFDRKSNSLFASFLDNMNNMKLEAADRLILKLRQFRSESELDDESLSNIKKALQVSIKTFNKPNPKQEFSRARELTIILQSLFSRSSIRSPSRSVIYPQASTSTSERTIS